MAISNIYPIISRKQKIIQIKICGKRIKNCHNNFRFRYLKCKSQKGLQGPHEAESGTAAPAERVVLDAKRGSQAPRVVAPTTATKDAIRSGGI